MSRRRLPPGVWAGTQATRTIERIIGRNHEPSLLGGTRCQPPTWRGYDSGGVCSLRTIRLPRKPGRTADPDFEPLMNDIEAKLFDRLLDETQAYLAAADGARTATEGL